MFRHNGFVCSWTGFLLIVGALAFSRPEAGGQAAPTPAPASISVVNPPDCRAGTKYPVILYDADRRRARIVNRDEIDKVTIGPDDRGAFTLNFYLGYELVNKPPYLCDGRPVEVYIYNRRLDTAYTVTLTSTYSLPAPVLDLRGATPPASAATTSPSTPPGSKGFASIGPAATNLTTDQAIALFLNDETFDKPFTQVANDAAAVLEQYHQFLMVAEQYDDYVGRIVGSTSRKERETPEGVSSLATLSGAWRDLEHDVRRTGYEPSEREFGDYTNRADRLQTEVTRVNARIQQYPMVDAMGNLKASAAAIRDNYRGVLAEDDSILRALAKLDKMSTQDLSQRAKAEKLNALRSHLTNATINTDTTLKLMVDSSPTEISALQLDRYNPCKGKNALKDKLHDLGAQDSVQRYCEGLGKLNNNLGLTPESSNSQDLPPAVLNELAEVVNRLHELQNGVSDTNAAEGNTLRLINEVYDKARAPVQVQNLNLAGASGSLVAHYTISRVEQFNRYQITNEIAEPISNCVLSISAASGTSGGFATCTTAAMSTPPAPAATLSSAQFPPSATPGAGATSSAGTNSATTVASPLPDYYGSVEIHHFSHGALVTGVAFDSVKQQSFSWVPCPTNSAYPNGNLPAPGSTTACASSSPTATTPVTYYQLTKGSQNTLAAIEGVNLFAFDRGFSRDMFSNNKPWRRPELFLGAAAYPLNHYYGGFTEEFVKGFHASAGGSIATRTSLPRNFGYAVGTASATNPTIPSASSLKGGYFFEVGFDTSLFVQIFNGSVFQNVVSIGSAGGATPTSSSGSTGSSSQ